MIYKGREIPLTTSEFMELHKKSVRAYVAKRTSISYPGTLKTIGNTYHIIVPKEYVLKCGWVDGEDVDVTIESVGDEEEE